MPNWWEMILGLGSSDTKADQPNGLALCVGLNAVDPDFYEGWDGMLNACENDASAMSHYLVSKGYHTNTLLTKQVTRNAVLTKLADFAKIAKPGDIVVFTNSSHGGQVPDYDNTESDGMDETICMYDGQLIDDELEAAWAKFAAGVRIVFVSDSCHSGTVARDHFSEHGRLLNLTPGSKALPQAVQTEIILGQSLKLQERKAEVSRQHHEISASVLAFGACQDNQTAMDGTVNGAFTGALLNVLRPGNKDCYGVAITRVRRLMPPTQTPSYTYAGPRISSFEYSAAFSL